jgi:hypothetical protein
MQRRLTPKARAALLYIDGDLSGEQPTSRMIDGLWSRRLIDWRHADETGTPGGWIVSDNGRRELAHEALIDQAKKLATR